MARPNFLLYHQFFSLHNLFLNGPPSSSDGGMKMGVGLSGTPGSASALNGTSALGVVGACYLPAQTSHINHTWRLIRVHPPPPAAGPKTASSSNASAIGNAIASQPCW
jgi:hypothetical protein